MFATGRKERPRHEKSGRLFNCRSWKRKERGGKTTGRIVMATVKGDRA